MSDDLEALWAQAKPVADDDLEALWAKAKPVEAKPENPGILKAALRGAGQGASLGYADEIGGVYRALSDLGADSSFGTRYRQGRDDYRAADAEAKAAEPEAFGTGEVGGAVASSFIPGLNIAKGAKLGATALKMAGVGGAVGLGNSEADLSSPDTVSIKRAGLDTAVGAGVGAGATGAGHLLGKALSRAASKLTGSADRRLAAAQAKAAEIGTEKAEKATRVARSEAGQDAQALYRSLEHIEALKAEGTPEALAKLAKLEADGTIRAIKQRLFETTTEELPAKLSKSQESRAAFGEALKTQGARAAEATTEAAQSSVRPDAWSMFRMYGEPVLGAAVGSGVGEAVFDSPKMGATLGTAGGLIFGRTRAGKALANRIAKPGNQIALANAIRKLGGAADAAGRAAPVVGTRARVGSVASAADDYVAAIPQVAEFLQSETDEARMQRLLAEYIRSQGVPR